MSAAERIDDPEVVNAFLSMIGASPITPRVVKTVRRDSDDKQTTDEQAPTTHRGEAGTGGGAHNSVPNTTGADLNKENAGTVTPGVRSRAHSTTSSPTVGTKAPPPTPVGASSSAEAVVKLEPIEEDETDVLVKLAEESKFGLVDSRFASKTGLRYPVPEYKPAPTSSTAHDQGYPGRTRISAPASIPKIKKDLVTKNSPVEYIDNVLAEYKEHKSEFQKDDEALRSSGHSSQQTSAPTSIATQEPLAATKKEYEAATPVKPLEKVSQDVHRAVSKDSTMRTEEAEIHTNSTPVTAISTSESKSEGQDEDREFLKHFKSWGKPEARDRPAARVRRVMISRLPADADLTLVQSLIHGGAIDDLVLMEASGVAYVRFTSADACDTYCAKYPNGMPFKYKGRSYTVFIDKSKDVDVISGMLQGWIDCGASRCVRAVGADEDWGMGALRKLAEGKNRKGKVENITDVFRNGIRTIVFRFSSIGDAVTFKATLMRDEDWEACNIQFAVDPCEKAVDVHIE